MISDGLIVVWIVVFSALNNTNPLLYTESIELALIIFDIFFALLVIKYWIPRAETKLKKNEEAEQKPLEPIKKEMCISIISNVTLLTEMFKKQLSFYKFTDCFNDFIDQIPSILFGEILSCRVLKTLRYCLLEMNRLEKRV